jgi:hypothetical protein
MRPGNILNSIRGCTLIGILMMNFTFLTNCDGSDVSDCFQTQGSQTEKFIQLPEFSSILINREIRAYIEQDDHYSIRIVTGENLINEVTAIVEEGGLVVTDHNTCNFVRDYETTTVYITAPDLKQIRSSTQFDISSLGTLDYQELRLVSEDFNQPDVFALGDFRLQLNTDELDVVSNNISSFFLEGSVNNLYVGFFNGVGRFEGEELVAQHVLVSHRGSNNMILNPQQSIQGEIRGAGDVICVNRPAIVNVNEVYTGQLIFTD